MAAANSREQQRLAAIQAQRGDPGVIPGHRGGDMSLADAKKNR